MMGFYRFASKSVGRTLITIMLAVAASALGALPLAVAKYSPALTHESAAVQSWRPVATAPHDDTRVLIWIMFNKKRGGIAAIGHTLNVRGANGDLVWRVDGAGVDGSAGGISDDNVIGWQPLPTGP